jgi:uncharacterized protein YigE (DUF2233 family)
MIRLFFQTLSVNLLAGVLLTGCLALAQGPAPGGRVDGELGTLIWRLGGWAEPRAALPSGGEERVAAAIDPRTGETYEVSLLYPEALAAWPVGLKAACRPAGAEAPLAVSDAAPFGGPNLKGAEPAALIDCLAALEGLLASGEWLTAPRFEEIEPGLSLAVSRAAYGPRLGSRELIVIKADMSRFRLAPYHEAEREGWSEFPAAVKGWAERLPSAVLVFNAGQYYPDRRHMGLLARDGLELPGRTHKSWKGFVCQGPAVGWDIIDEDTRPPGAPGPESCPSLVQTHMILDRLGRLRVRDTDRLASRSALGLDREDRLWLVVVPGAVSLYDFGLLLARLELVSAVGLDGGLETQVALAAPEGPRIWLGSAANNFLGTFLVDNLTPTLPAVIALERIEPAR